MAYVLELVSLENSYLPEQILNDREIKKYSSFKFEKRRTDWFAGRLVAKKAVTKALDLAINYKDIEILNESSRKPYFQVKGKRCPNVLSISHCLGYAVSAVGTGNNTLLGIDMELIEKRSDVWKEQFFNTDELASKNDDTMLTMLWTQKEAVLKALGIGMNADLHQLAIIQGKPSFSKDLLNIWKDMGSKTIYIKSHFKPNGYIISIAFDF